MTSRNVAIEAGVGEVVVTGYAPTVWITATFAPRWYADAARETAVPGRDARRREIVFAVCCAESYLIEWVRDEVLNGEFDELVKFFPIGKRVGILGRWKGVVEKLAKQNRIPKSKDFERNGVWQDFKELVTYRDGLVHGQTGRPATSPQPAGFKLAAGRLLDERDPGWATKIIRSLILDLHSTMGTAPPSWAVPP